MKTDNNRPAYGDYGRPTITMATITEVGIRDLDNLVVCEVMDAMGNFHKGVETIMPGGGSSENFTSSPYTAGQEVFLIQMSHNEPPYIIGSVFKSASIVPSRNIEFSDTGEDRNVVGVRDYVISNRGNILNLTDAYGVVVSANKDIRLQLGNEGILRISKNGLCDDYPIKGAQFLTHYNDFTGEMYDKLEQASGMQTDITANIDALMAAIDLACQNIITPPTAELQPAGGPAAVVAAMTTLKTTVNGLQAIALASKDADAVLQALPIRSKQDAASEAVASLCTSIRLPKTPE